MLIQHFTVDDTTTIETRWPARQRPLYGLDVEVPMFFPAALERPPLATVRVPVDDPRSPATVPGENGDEGVYVIDDAVFGPGGPYRVTALKPTEELVDPPFGVAVKPSAENDLGPGCAVVEVRLLDGGTEVANLGWDLRPAALSYPIVNLDPLVSSTEEITAAPAAPKGCDANTDTPDTVDGPGSQYTFDTPAEALLAFLDTEAAETFIKGGFHEMIADDGIRTYGITDDIPLVPPTSADNFVTLITVEQGPEGWQVTGWTGSGC